MPIWKQRLFARLQNQAGDEMGEESGGTDQAVEDEVPEEDTEEPAEASPEDDTVTVSIGEAPPQEEETAAAPEWVRELRKSHRELQKQNRELQAKLQTSSQPATVTLGPKPTLEAHDYDSDKYEAALVDWVQKKAAVDNEAKKAEQAAQAAQEAWQAKLTSYATAKTELKVKDFDDAEEVAQNTFSVTQQGIILQGAENPALLIYALGKNPAKAKELAAITDPVKYAFAVAKLEKDLKVTPRKAPPPESRVTGSGAISGSVDSQLERLRAEAAKTGDFTKVVQYKNSRKK